MSSAVFLASRPRKKVIVVTSPSFVGLRRIGVLGEPNATIGQVFFFPVSISPLLFPPPLSLTSCRPKGRRTDERWRWRKEEERRVGLLPSLHHSPSSSPSSLSLSSSSSSLRSSSPFRSVVRSTRKRREEESRGQSTEKGRGLGSTSRSPFARGLWR